MQLSLYEAAKMGFKESTFLRFGLSLRGSEVWE